jgi:hypothetical protein
MPRSLLLLAFLAQLAWLPVAAPAQYLFALDGYGYEDPDPDPSRVGESGAAFVGVGTIHDFGAITPADPALHEYTFHLSGLTVTREETFGPYVVLEYTGPGRFRIHEDSLPFGTPADYLANPPNAAVPADFIDGTVVLELAVGQLQLVIDTTTGEGNWTFYEVVATDGVWADHPAALGWDGVAWIVDLTTDLGTNDPEGFACRLDGIAFQEALPVESTTWGAIKRQYRTP